MKLKIFCAVWNGSLSGIFSVEMEVFWNTYSNSFTYLRKKVLDSNLKSYQTNHLETWYD